MQGNARSKQTGDMPVKLFCTDGMQSADAQDCLLSEEAQAKLRARNVENKKQAQVRIASYSAYE